MKIAIVNLITRELSGGYLKYLRNVLPKFSNSFSITSLKCFLSESALEKFSNSTSNIGFIIIPNYHLYDHNIFFQINKMLEEFRPDVCFVPIEKYLNYNKAPLVIMLQNMEPFVCPFDGNPFREKVKNLFRYFVGKMAMKRADRIIAISKFVRDYLITNMGISPEKIGHVYHGIDALKGSVIKPKVITDDLKEFIFTAGSIRPARGLEDLIGALGLLRDKGFIIPLVVAGSADKAMLPYLKKLKQIIERHRLSEHVIWAGQLNEEEIGWCYINCKMFVMTSRVEACPNIVLEAMAHGCVCISTKSPPMPEFFQDAAVYYPPKDSQALADRLIEVLSWDKDKRNDMSERARKRASQFSWDVCAQKTIEQFQIAIDEFKAKKKNR